MKILQTIIFMLMLSSIICLVSAENNTTIININNPNQEAFYGNLNLYFLFFVVVILIAVGAFVPIVGIMACVVSIAGMLSAFNQSFAMGFLFFIALFIGLIEGLSGTNIL
jgi:hypothetical protein